MIRLQGITLSRGGIELLHIAHASILPGERVALVGPNGCGKSSLLGALAGDVLLDAGDIDRPPGRLVRLDQAVPGGTTPIWRYVFEADAALVAASRALDGAQQEGGMALAEAHDRWDQLGGHAARARIGELLAGLGFAESQAQSAIESLSGGWRMRLNLARALFVPSDLLLLDEPTNHLDLDAIVWLERWLQRYPGTAIIVSHDRDFLDRVVHATLSFEDRGLVRYAGGYTASERMRAERHAQAERQATQQADRVAHLNAFITRFRAKATKARQVQSRIKALEKMVQIAPVRGSRSVDFTLPDPGDTPDPLILADGLVAGYPGAEILAGVRLKISRGSRIGILGRNGAGKSTLIRTLVGDLAPIRGEVARARALRVGYFAQHGVEQLRPDDTPLGLLRRLWPDETESTLRSELGRFGFSADHALRPIGPMSGGEKSRLLLATIVRTRPHLLVLDEPTNHLDGETRDALTDALAEFDGALLLVSHDRYLMRATVDQLVLVDAGGVTEFEGDLDDYLSWLQRDRAAAAASDRDARTPGPAVDRKEERRLAAQRRQAMAALLKPIDQEIQRTEQALAKLEQTLASIESELANPLLYRDGQRVTELSRERSALVRERDALENRWLASSEQRDRILAEQQPVS
jgi:ATP-binding cassette subfamily F protein 3